MSRWPVDPAEYDRRLMTCRWPPFNLSPFCLFRAVRAGVLVLVSGAAAGGPLEEAEGWHLRHVDETQGIEIYQRDRPDHMPEFLAVTRVTARLSTLVAVLRDVQAMPRWVYRTREVQVLDGSGGMRGLVRVLTAMPWPLNDREAIVEWQWRQDPVSGEVRLDSTRSAQRAAPMDGVVRMPQFNSQWRFLPQPGGVVEVRFTGHGHMGGNLGTEPLRSFVATAAWLAPLETMRGLREMIQLPGYQNARVPFIRELP